MSKPMRALLMLVVLGCTSGLASPSSPREFHARQGLVRVAMAPVSPLAETDSAGNAVPAAVFDLGSVDDLTALPLAEVRGDPLLEIYLLDHYTGKELRFPAKLSHLQDFLRSHGKEITGVTAGERSVAMVKALSAGMRVHMVAPGTGEPK